MFAIRATTNYEVVDRAFNQLQCGAVLTRSIFSRTTYPTNSACHTHTGTCHNTGMKLLDWCYNVVPCNMILHTSMQWLRQNINTTIGIDIRSSCCSFLATQTMVCSKMKDKIWQKARDKKHFIRDEIYWWQRERTLMGHAHIVWVLLSAARIAVRALNCITYHVAEPVGVWNGLCAPASKPSNLLNSCVFILDAL